MLFIQWLDKSAACSTGQDTCEILFFTNDVAVLVSMQQTVLQQTKADFLNVVAGMQDYAYCRALCFL